jgi:hypothetical protein
LGTAPRGGPEAGGEDALQFKEQNSPISRIHCDRLANDLALVTSKTTMMPSALR